MNTILFYLFFLIFVSVFLLLYYVWTNKEISCFIQRYQYVLISIIALSLIYKLPFDFNFFQGLEYEDSYLASSISRYLMYNRDVAESSFLANACGIGSLANCEVSFTHSGNLIGLPVIGWLTNEVFGYNVNNIALINLWFSIISTICIFLIGYKISKTYLLGLISSYVFITTPVLNSLHTSSLFETSSSCFVTLSLLIFILYFEEFKKGNSLNRIVLFLILIFINLLSVHFKRENIIIIFFPLIMLLVSFLKDKKSLIVSLKKLFPYLLFLLGLGVYYIYILDVPMSIKVESDYAIGYPFQLKFFLPLFQMFIDGFATYKWFYIYGIFLIIGIIFIPFNIKRNPLILYPAFILILFLMINSVHHRSYYFVRSGVVTAFDSLRHINMLSPFFAIVTGYGIFRLIQLIKERNFLKGKINVVFYILTFLMSIHLLFLTYQSRVDLIEIEKHNRILPISTLIQSINQEEDIVITDQSILLQNYCEPNLRIIEFTALGDIISNEQINSLMQENRIFLLWKDYFNEDVFRNRYKHSFETLDQINKSVVRNCEGFQIIELK